MSPFWRREPQSEVIPTPENAERLRVRFVGRVQGVGFRWTALMVARRLSLTGWVRNEPDGSVVAEVQGEPAHVGAFFSNMLEEFSGRGQRASYTIDERDEIPVVRGERDFEVRYYAPNGWVAQLVEQGTENPRVRGSTPFPATRTFAGPDAPRIGACSFLRAKRGTSPHDGPVMVKTHPHTSIESP